MTADDRYGPYGYGEDGKDYSRQRVDWDRVDWGGLQEHCLARNSFRFGQISSGWPTKMSLPKASNAAALPARDPYSSTGRTAVVVRSWSGQKYPLHVRLYLRSLITEAALSSGASYAVFLLVDVNSRERGIFDSDANYQAALNELVPSEFHSIAVLFDEWLLESWYPMVEQHS